MALIHPALISVFQRKPGRMLFKNVGNTSCRKKERRKQRGVGEDRRKRNMK
jgi:hypothetical protein